MEALWLGCGANGMKVFKANVYVYKNTHFLSPCVRFSLLGEFAILCSFKFILICCVLDFVLEVS